VCLMPSPPCRSESHSGHDLWAPFPHLPQPTPVQPICLASPIKFYNQFSTLPHICWARLLNTDPERAARPGVGSSLSVCNKPDFISILSRLALAADFARRLGPAFHLQTMVLDRPYTPAGQGNLRLFSCNRRTTAMAVRT
jgi:hypothetical protein